MSPAQLAKAFEPFYTTRAIGTGTGLGLSTARNIVLAHQRKHRAGQHPGRGHHGNALLPDRAMTDYKSLFTGRSDAREKTPASHLAAQISPVAGQIPEPASSMRCAGCSARKTTRSSPPTAARTGWPGSPRGRCSFGHQRLHDAGHERRPQFLREVKQRSPDTWR